MGGSSLTPSMRDFDSFISECELLDPPLRNASFTGQICKSLPCVRDWIVFSTQMSGVALSPRPSRSLNQKDIGSTGQSLWIPTRLCGGQLLFGLRICGYNTLISRRTLEIGGVGFKELDGKVITNFDAIEQEGGLNPDLISQRVSRKGELEEFNIEGGNALETKSQSEMGQGRDCNSKFYHKVANGRRNRKYIKELENERDWSPISEESALRLDSPFTEEEISKAIFQLDRDKAPGPDGFTIAVFQECWDVIKEDLRISDFRPISLITSLYKIIAKVLSGRLRGVLHETIHYTQGAFVQGRQILDAVLIANEIVDERRRSGEEGVVFKIDFEKAYDHVKWDFLDHVLEKKGIKGLRQGDPLSPFLFTLVADVLSRMLMRAEERNMWRVSGEEELQTLKSLLLVFGHISGLKVNLNKSSIYGINLDQAHLSRLAEMLDCKASGWPILYLGSLWAGILRRVDFGIQWGWGRQKGSLSEVGYCVQTKDNRGLGLGNISWRNLALLGKCYGDGLIAVLGKAIAQVFQEFSLITRCQIMTFILVRAFFSQILFLALSQSSGSSQNFPSKFVWNSQVPFKVKSFVWLFQLAKLEWVSPRSIYDMMSIKFKGFGNSKRGIVLWQAASIALIRVVWWEETQDFEDKARNSEYLWDSIVFLASLWAFCSKAFKGIPLNVIQLDWIAVCTP
ncbi:Transposon TX1 uncharacterized 149 kDa protein [Vitis vinifera]|uniref:Transposon TX1 uncharacterized 149 kDa protein n=1 Tax=Vitis vinifera TaxID=29760 RepID=A0A438JC21_VITVI|nr:Transposon TX1 uncharacterized 149 kDa protein [Vitis vinifera]